MSQEQSIKIRKEKHTIKITLKKKKKIKKNSHFSKYLSPTIVCKRFY